jgi:hypothetical protein
VRAFEGFFESVIFSPSCGGACGGNHFRNVCPRSSESGFRCVLFGSEFVISEVFRRGVV